MSTIFASLDKVLEERKNSESESSYIASLHQKGLNKILEKVGEESIEAILAAKDAKLSGNSQDLISETADLWFHTLVMLSHLNCSSDDVLEELARRFGISGIDEKAARKPTQ